MYHIILILKYLTIIIIIIICVRDTMSTFLFPMSDFINCCGGVRDNIVFEIYTQYSIVASSISFRGVADINKLN